MAIHKKKQQQHKNINSGTLKPASQKKNKTHRLIKKKALQNITTH